MNAPDAAGQLRWLGLSGALIAADQWSKALIENSFVLHETRAILPVFNLVRAHNRGAAFSFLDGAGGWQRWVFTALAAVISVLLLGWLRRLPRSSNMLAAALACILAGAIGNVIDRLRFGAVVDFLDFHWAGYHWPAFNIADSAITLGVIFLITDGLFRRPEGSKKTAAR